MYATWQKRKEKPYFSLNVIYLFCRKCLCHEMFFFVLKMFKFARVLNICKISANLINIPCQSLIFLFESVQLIENMHTAF